MMTAPNPKPVQELTGHFRDGPIAGLQYRSPSREGITDAQGRFGYLAGEAVEFFIGTLAIGTATPGPPLTLASLYGRAQRAPSADLSCPQTVNRARFVLSLAQARDLADGVTIDSLVGDLVSHHADRISFDLGTESFERSPAVRAVFSELGLRLRGAAEVRNHMRRAQAGIKVLRDVRIPTRDGSYLLADVFRPTDEGTYPVLLRLGIYGRAFGMGSILDDADMQASEEREAAWFEQDRAGISPYIRYSESAVSANASVWVPRGYVLVRVDGRGVGRTPGMLEPFSHQEALDFYDAIEWSADQSWSDGNVGLYGGSYNATIQWNVAALGPPSLKAIAPLASDADAYRDLAYPGGIFAEGYRRYWWHEMVAEAARPGDAVDFVDGLAGHPWDGAYYQGGALLTADFSRIEVPVITAVSQTAMVHARAGFEAMSQLASRDKRLLVWDAGYTSYMYEDCQGDLEVFFDEHLKGRKPARRPAPVRMIVRSGGGEFDWHDADEWPVPGTEYRTLFLSAEVAGGPGSITGTVPSDVRQIEYSADVHASAPALPTAVFQSTPLEEDITLAGHFHATLWIESTSADADLFVALRVMDGPREITYRTREPASQAPLTWGCLKVSHRALDPERTTTTRPWHRHRVADALPLSAADVVRVDVELMAATGRIAAGHALRVEISPAEGPGVTPGHERAYDESYHRGAVNRILTGGDFASSITVPVLPGYNPIPRPDPRQ